MQVRGRRGVRTRKTVPNAISVVVLGRSLTQQERVLLRSASHNLSVVAIVAELPNAPQVLEEMNRLRPQVALVLLNGDVHHSFQLVQRIRQELPATVIICSSENHSPDLILESLRSGAIDFLRQPFDTGEVAKVFERVEREVHRPEESTLGRVVAVYSSKGGCGTTFLAANLAATLTRPGGKRSTIIDLNLQAGDQPLYLGLEPNYSIHDVVRNFDRLDDQLLGNYLTQRSKYLSLLAAPTEITKEEDIRVEHVTRAITLLRSQSDYVVIDPPRVLNDITVAALDAADDLILLMTLDIPAIRSAKRALDIFRLFGYSQDRIRLVINRFVKSPEFDVRKVEKVLETPVYATIANDYHAVIASINVGEPLVLSKTQSRVVHDIQTIADKLTGRGNQPPSRSMADPQVQAKKPARGLTGLLTGLLGDPKPSAGSSEGSGS
jgi:pilus assembly protein CpaE